MKKCMGGLVDQETVARPVYRGSIVGEEGGDRGDDTPPLRWMIIRMVYRMG